MYLSINVTNAWAYAILLQVFLANMDDFVAVNGVYSKYFDGHKPARSAVQVARLPLNALFEIECIARYVSHESNDVSCDAHNI